MSEFVIRAHRNLVVTPEEVWAVTSDTSRYADWVTSVHEVHTHHGHAEVGGQYTETVASLGPLTTHATWTVRDLEPTRLRIDSGTGFAPLRDVVNIFRFAPLSGGAATSMTYEFHFDLTPRPLGALAHRILRTGMVADFDRSMRALEAVVLSERTDPDTPRPMPNHPAPTGKANS
ncbi:MAG: SRPBCC family protein [Rhodococcus sp. (in: high G+C Gram-positive bacteria)]|uniref:SRPBCC family protein n=1 Tax=Rhodococcus sp. TaxID=1831 RepID=UPI003BB685A4